MEGCKESTLHPSLVAQMVKNPPAMRETWVRSLGWEESLEKGLLMVISLLALSGSTEVMLSWIAPSQ